MTTSRLVAVDLARGIALIGMMLAHLGTSWTGQGTPPVGDLLSTGRAAPLFALLAGVALTLVHRRDPRGVGSVRATVIRGVLLVLLGLALGSLRDMPILIILAVYGVLIIAVLPARHLPTRPLLGLTVAWSVLAPIGLLALRISRDPVLVEQPTWPDLQHPSQLIGTVVLWGGYPAIVWVAFVLAGLLVGRLDLSDGQVGAQLFGGGLALASATLAIGRLFEPDWRQLFARDLYPSTPVDWTDVWVTSPHSSMPLNVIGAMGSAVMVVGLCVMLARVPAVAKLVWPLAAAGSMTLTLYTVHALWTWRLRLDDPVPDEGGWGPWALQVVALVAAATVWRWRLRRGPLETVMRWLSRPRRADSEGPDTTKTPSVEQ
ncbi:DUF418 domain-containing protein [Aeromicrobium sp. CF3.5]|uniref:DUF418 domain-containing protein n=1 Tax=Aeromicrobium sp. CF3.5 TaxID=3373078 RepID=UPI003EE78950